MPVTERVTAAMMTGTSEEELRRLSQRPTLLDDGLTKVRAGVTSLDELLRVIAV
jgi:type II secretory ATPase GspE/PulE/Tfp pilus assembly ATPase PilB-like protein